MPVENIITVRQRELQSRPLPCDTRHCNINQSKAKFLSTIILKRKLITFPFYRNLKKLLELCLLNLTAVFKN